MFPHSYSGRRHGEEFRLPQWNKSVGVRLCFAVQDFGKRCVHAKALAKGLTMKALTWRGKGDIRCESVPDPKIEHPRDAIIKLTACAICGSDLHIYDGVIPEMEKGDQLAERRIAVIAGTTNEGALARELRRRRLAAWSQIRAPSCQIRRCCWRGTAAKYRSMTAARQSSTIAARSLGPFSCFVR